MKRYSCILFILFFSFILGFSMINAENEDIYYCLYNTLEEESESFEFVPFLDGKPQITIDIPGSESSNLPKADTPNINEKASSGSSSSSESSSSNYDKRFAEFNNCILERKENCKLQLGDEVYSYEIENKLSENVKSILPNSELGRAIENVEGITNKIDESKTTKTLEDYSYKNFGSLLNKFPFDRRMNFYIFSFITIFILIRLFW